jgi:methylmalonyl-CoA mutase N-terminal domain/subunit
MNNVVRTALEALTAVLGGTQSLHTNALDEVLALPTEHAARLALRTQQVIAFESGVADVADPLGGSYVVERATDEIEARAEELFAHIDELGNGSMLDGVLAGIERGWFQQLIAESAFEEQRRLESGDLVKVGVNAFVDPGAGTVDTLVIGPEAEVQQREAVARTRSRRDAAAAEDVLDRLAAAASDPDAELIEPLIACARARCTEGEIVRTLVTVFGDYRETPRY